MALSFVCRGLEPVETMILRPSGDQVGSTLPLLSTPVANFRRKTGNAKASADDRHHFTAQGVSEHNELHKSFEESPNGKCRPSAIA